MKIARNPPRRRMGAALHFECADIAIALRGAIAKRMTIDDCSGGVQQLSLWADVPGTAEKRMVGYPILDAELAKPPICQIDLHLGAQSPLRADRKHIANYQHPDHQHRVDRRPTRVRVVSRKLLVHPIKIENAVDLPNQMIGRHRLVEIERVEELTCSALSPPHHRPLPANRTPDSRNHGSTAVSTRVLQHNQR